ncbi:helix-turn-helix transcriptional regulator [Lentilactobacillus hilgardii]|uniref:helix-turn-helix transcriptional regulator n=1 Tax=Lentilactobacillus hilgardii TaxID=1588 RepID=UPI0039EB9367
MMNKMKNETIVAFHPGYYVEGFLSETGMNQRELAKRLNTTDEAVNKLINGKINLNNHLISGLSLVLGTSKELWENLDKTYRQNKQRIDSTSQK